MAPARNSCESFAQAPDEDEPGLPPIPEPREPAPGPELPPEPQPPAPGDPIPEGSGGVFPRT